MNKLKGIAAVAATSVIAAFTMVSAVSAASNSLSESMSEGTYSSYSNFREVNDYTTNIGGTIDGGGYSNPSSEANVDINCYNIYGHQVTTNTITNGLNTSLKAFPTYSTNYKWCVISLTNLKGDNKTVSSIRVDYQNQQMVEVYNPGPGGVLDQAFYTYCIYDGYYANSDILGKTVLNLQLS